MHSPEKVMFPVHLLIWKRCFSLSNHLTALAVIITCDLLQYSLIIELLHCLHLDNFFYFLFFYNKLVWYSLVYCSMDSPLYCPPAGTVSSCVPCRWTSASMMSANQSCHSGPGWQQLWSWSAHPGQPPTTDTCLRCEETNLQLLQRERKSNINLFYFSLQGKRCNRLLSHMLIVVKHLKQFKTDFNALIKWFDICLWTEIFVSLR